MILKQENANVARISGWKQGSKRGIDTAADTATVATESDSNNVHVSCSKASSLLPRSRGGQLTPKEGAENPRDSYLGARHQVADESLAGGGGGENTMRLSLRGTQVLKRCEPERGCPG